MTNEIIGLSRIESVLIYENGLHVQLFTKRNSFEMQFSRHGYKKHDYLV